MFKKQKQIIKKKRQIRMKSFANISTKKILRRKTESLYQQHFISNDNKRISGKNRPFSSDDLKIIIQDYFVTDPEFQELGIEKAWEQLLSKGHILGFASDKDFNYASKKGIDLNRQATKAETIRKPFLGTIFNLPISTTNEIVDDLEIAQKSRIHAFAGNRTSIHEMLNESESRYNQVVKDKNNAKPVYPLSVVADLTSFKKDSTMHQMVIRINELWNMFYLDDELQTLRESSLVLSDMGAISKAHFHPYVHKSCDMRYKMLYVV